MRKTNKLLKALKGWEFDTKALRESEEGAFVSSLDRRSPRAFSTNVSNDILPYNDKYSLSPNGNICEYSGLPSVKSYQ